MHAQDGTVLAERIQHMYMSRQPYIVYLMQTKQSLALTRQYLTHHSARLAAALSISATVS